VAAVDVSRGGVFRRAHLRMSAQEGSVVSRGRRLRHVHLRREVQEGFSGEDVFVWSFVGGAGGVSMRCWALWGT
jgi:hypothetical protein